MRKAVKRNNKNPTKKKENRKKTLEPKTRQESKVKLEISGNKTWNVSTMMSVTGRLQMKPTMKGPSTDPGMHAEILERRPRTFKLCNQS